MHGRKLLRAGNFWVRSNKEQPWKWGFPGSFRQAGECQFPKGEALGAFTSFFPIQTHLGRCSSDLLSSWGCWFSGPHRDGVRKRQLGKLKHRNLTVFTDVRALSLDKLGLWPAVVELPSSAKAALPSSLMSSLMLQRNIFSWSGPDCHEDPHSIMLAYGITVSLFLSSGTWKVCLGWTESCNYEHNSPTVRRAEPEDKWSLNLPYFQSFCESSSGIPFMEEKNSLT